MHFSQRVGWCVLAWALCALGTVLGADVPAAPAAGEARLLSVARVVTNDVSDRIYYDFRVDADLRTAAGVQFDVCCSDLAAFSSFSIYFQSGEGWYLARFAPEKENAWQHIELPRRLVERVEGTPDGWQKISCVRICGWHAGKRRGSFACANLAFLGGRPRAFIVCGDSCGRKSPNEQNGFSQYAGTVSSAFEILGYPAAIVSDYDIVPEMLDGIELLVFPYNPSLSTNAAATLSAHLAKNGKVFACYCLPKEIQSALGLAHGGMLYPRKEGLSSYSGLARTATPLAGQPAFVEQPSWAATVPTITGEGRVLATWCGAKKADTGIAGLVETPNGIFLGHVWLGTTPAARQLMRVLLEKVVPASKPILEAHAAACRAEEQAILDYVKSVPAKPDAFRGFWCHSAWGLGGEHDWDSSIRFLKEMGFTDIVANLAWGGMAFYQSDVLPISPDCAQKGDALEQALAACRKYGVRLHVWKVCWRMNHGCTKEYRAQMKAAGRTQVTFNGKEEDGWFCPSHPENLKAEIEAMCELAAKGVDGVHFDYIRYPDSQSCYCAGCRARFEKKLGRAVAHWPADLKKDAELSAAWKTFRSDNITAAVRGVAERLHGKSPVQISAAVFRDAELDPQTVGQDWGRWCREGWLDFVCPMDYSPSAALHLAVVKRQMPFVGKAKFYPGIGLSCWPRDGHDVDRLARQIADIRALGLEGFNVFNFDARAEAALPILRLGPTADVK